MSWPEWLGQEILIRLPDNNIGFFYVVKYSGVTVRRGFVANMDEEPTEHPKLFAWREAAENETPDEEEGDAR